MNVDYYYMIVCLRGRETAHLVWSSNIVNALTNIGIGIVNVALLSANMN